MMKKYKNIKEFIKHISKKHEEHIRNDKLNSEFFSLGIKFAIEEMNNGLQIKCETNKDLDFLCVKQTYLKRKYRENYNKGFKDGVRNASNSEFSRKQLNGG